MISKTQKRPIFVKTLLLLTFVIISFASLYNLALAETASSAVEPALIGKASSGELLFYPCTKCHPIGATNAQARPNQFAKHQIKLASHDKLGKGNQACLVCHDDPNKNPGLLKTIDGSLIEITGDTSLVCYRCHQDKYKAFKSGAHGKMPLKLDATYGENTSCTVKGCHDPHTPSIIGITPLLPFLGTTIEIAIKGERKSFVALPAPQNAPPVNTPASLKAMAFFGVILALGLACGPLVVDRAKKMYRTDGGSSLSRLTSRRPRKGMDE